MKNFTVSRCYKQPNGNCKNHCNHLQEILIKATMENKIYFVTGNFNLSCFEFHQSPEIRQFFNNKFEQGAIPLINVLELPHEVQRLETTFLQTASLIHLSKKEYFYFRALCNICSD